VKLYVGDRPIFYVFTFFFQISKKHDFLRFFELLHTFSRTLITALRPENFLETYAQFGAVCYPHQTPTKKLRKKLGGSSKL